MNKIDIGVMKMMVLVDIELKGHDESYTGDEYHLASVYDELSQDDKDEYDLWLFELEVEMDNVMRKVGGYGYISSDLVLYPDVYVLDGGYKGLGVTTQQGGDTGIAMT